MKFFRKEIDKCTDPNVALFVLDCEMNYFNDVDPHDVEMKQKVRKHLAECKACREDYEFTNLCYKTYRKYPDLLSNPEIYLKGEQQVPLNLRSLLSTAAFVVVILALVAVGYFYYKHAMNRNRLMIYARLSTIEKAPYDPLIIRSEEGIAATFFAEGMEAYQRNNFSKATQKLKEAVKSDPRKTIYAYYLGISYLMQGRFSEGVKPLETSSTTGGELLQEDAKWYLSNAYLKLGKVADAARELEAIATRGVIRKADATILLQRMKEVTKQINNR